MNAGAERKPNVFGLPQVNLPSYLPSHNISILHFPQRSTLFFFELPVRIRVVNGTSDWVTTIIRRL